MMMMISTVAFVTTSFGFNKSTFFSITENNSHLSLSHPHQRHNCSSPRPSSHKSPIHHRLSSTSIAKATSTATTTTTSTNNDNSTSSLSSSRRDFLKLLSTFAVTSAVTTTLFPCTSISSTKSKTSISSAYDLSPLKNGIPFPLSKYSGKVTLFVNVASYCALTPQYSGLVSLHDTYQPQGFEIIASPCNQFARQEPGSNEEICTQIQKTFGARFVLLDKLIVNESPPDGPVDPLYRFLRDQAPEKKGQPIGWNFEKFLVDANGHVLRRYSPGIQPSDIESDIQYALKHPGEILPPKPKPYLGVA